MAKQNPSDKHSPSQTNIDPSTHFKNIYMNLLNSSSHIQQGKIGASADVASLASVLREEAMEQANESFVNMMDIRNQLTEAYQEVVKLQTAR
jgi:flagellar hook-basal body complex protein FliE